MSDVTPQQLQAERMTLAAENARLRERVEALARECGAWRSSWGAWRNIDAYLPPTVNDARADTDRLRALEGP